MIPGTTRSIRRKQNGFTLAEVLATIAFLAIVIPVIVEGLTISSRAGVTSERSSIALELAENQLNELVLNGAWVTAESKGDFGTDWPGYRWELGEVQWNADAAMIELSIAVYFEVQGREKNIHLSTLVNSSL